MEALQTLFPASESLRLAPDHSLSVPVDLKAEFPLCFSVRIPAASGPSVRLELRDGDAVIAAWDNTGVATATWQAAGPFHLRAGRHRLAFRAAPAHDAAWPAGTELFQLASMSLDKVSITPAEILAAAIPDVAAGLATAGGPNDQIEYFTSFDATNPPYYFLSLIPWIYNPTIVLGAPVQQSSAQSLTGPYSAQLYESVISTSYIQSNSLPIPTGANQVMVSVWCYPNAPTVLNYSLYLDGTATQTGTWRFSNSDVGNWVLRTTTLQVGAAQNFYCWYQLKPFLSISANVVYTDNFTVDFQMTVPPYVSKLIDTDMNGAVYALNQATGTAVWSFQCSHGFVTSAPVVVNGSAYFADGGGGTLCSMYALNADTGVSNWTAAMSGNCTTTPQFDSQGTYAATSAGLLYGFNSVTGAQLFTPINFMNLSANQYVAVNGMVMADGVAYLSAANGVYAVSVVTKALLWSYPTLEIPWEIALSNGSVFAGCVNGSLYCLSAANGFANWKFNSAGPINSSPQVVGGVVMFGCDAGLLYGVNVLTGASLWTLPFPTTFVRAFTMAGLRLYVIASAAHAVVYGYDVAIDGTSWTFTKRWVFDFSVGADMPPVPEGDTIYFTANNKNVYALAVADGTQQWMYSTGRVGFTAPCIVYYDPLLTLNRRYDQYCYLTAHNAYASTAEGWLYAQQTSDIATQLRDGVRGLMLDVWTQVVGGVNQVVFCHGSCTTSYFIQPFVAWPLLVNTLEQIKIFLDNNPSEVVTIIFEQHLGSNAGLLLPTFTTAGLGNYLFLANQTGTSADGESTQPST